LWHHYYNAESITRILSEIHSDSFLHQNSIQMELHKDEIISSCLIILAFLFLVLCIVNGFVVVLIIVGHHIRDREVKERVHICLYGILLGLKMAFYRRFIKSVEHSFIEQDVSKHSPDPFDLISNWINNRMKLQGVVGLLNESAWWIDTRFFTWKDMIFKDYES
jgi:hypothetical protein